MRRSFAKTTLFAVALSLPLCEPASADFMEALKISPHSAPFFEVESDGESWTSIKPGSHQLKVNIDIEAGSGWRVTNAYIAVPNADFGGTSNQSAATLRMGGGEDVKSLKFVQPYSFDTDDLGLDRLTIIAACNARRSSADAKTRCVLRYRRGDQSLFYEKKGRQNPRRG